MRHPFLHAALWTFAGIGVGFCILAGAFAVLMSIDPADDSPSIRSSAGPRGEH